MQANKKGIEETLFLIQHPPPRFTPTFLLVPFYK
jgi:hypothetical protein